MPTIPIKVSNEEKKKLEIAKAVSGADTWKEFLFNLLEHSEFDVDPYEMSFEFPSDESE